MQVLPDYKATLLNKNIFHLRKFIILLALDLRTDLDQILKNEADQCNCGSCKKK